MDNGRTPNKVGRVVSNTSKLKNLSIGFGGVYSSSVGVPLRPLFTTKIQQLPGSTKQK